MTAAPTPPPGTECLSFSSTERRQAWAVHLLTASGLIVGMLALHNILLGHPRSAMVWLWATQVIDGIDGPIARNYKVKERVPKIDGYVLDLIIDFVTCVIIPAAFIHEFHLLPGRYSLVLTGLVVLSGAIWFSRTDMMTDDHWFRGFPAVWNLAAPTLLLLGTRPWIAAVVVVVLAVCSFTDIPCPHPVRVTQWRSITLPVTVAWLGAMIWLTLIFHRNHQQPPFRHITSPLILRSLLIAAPLYFVVLAWVRHFDLRRTEQAAGSADGTLDGESSHLRRRSRSRRMRSTSRLKPSRTRRTPSGSRLKPSASRSKSSASRSKPFDSQSTKVSQSKSA